MNTKGTAPADFDLFKLMGIEMCGEMPTAEEVAKRAEERKVAKLRHAMSIPHPILANRPSKPAGFYR